MNEDKKKCCEIYRAYENALRKLKLVPHPSQEKNQYDATFWECKSKPPYKWTSEKNQGIPWIGFVGYELNCNCEIRVRRSSLKKEVNKQFELIEEVRRSVSQGKNKTGFSKILKSVNHRLIGMSIGRVWLWNFEIANSEMCWLTGFKLLYSNKHLNKQLKNLDRTRNMYIRRLYNELRGLKSSRNSDENKNSQEIFYGKPFSYFYQIKRKSCIR